MLSEPKTAFVAQTADGYLAHDKNSTPYIYQAETFDNMRACEAFAKDAPGFVKVTEIVIF